jgi:integral membrane sensor domain MASE1
MLEMTATTISGISLHATPNAAIVEVVTIEKVSSWTRCSNLLRKVVFTAYLDDWNRICIVEEREQVNE